MPFQISLFSKNIDAAVTVNSHSRSIYFSIYLPDCPCEYINIYREKYHRCINDV